MAIVNNKEKLLKLGEQLFQEGADFCREQLKQHENVIYADQVDTGAYQEVTEKYPESDFLDNEPTTPYDSDEETAYATGSELSESRKLDDIDTLSVD